MAEGGEERSRALFPLFVDLSDATVLCVGGGAIATRRVGTILPFAGEVAVVAPDVSDEIAQLAADGRVRLERRRFEECDLKVAQLVLACTDDAYLNAAIVEAARARGIPANSCSDQELCDFQFPSVVRRGSAVVGVNAAGTDHALVKRIRQRIERLFAEEDL